MKPADIVFMLDESVSIRRDDFAKQLAFVEQFVTNFTIGDRGARIGVSTYGSEVTHHFWMNTFSNRDSIFKAVSQIKQKKGYVLYPCHPLPSQPRLQRPRA